jgi:hypothetical protein
VLAHWPRQVGLGDPYADAQAALSGHATVSLSTLQAAANLSPDTVFAQGQQAYAQLSSNLQAQWASATSPSQNNARIAAGVSSAADLLSNGYDPHNDADNQKLIVAVAGAVSTIVPVGSVIGGALLLLDAVGEAVAKVLEDVGLIWFGCRSSNNWTIGGAFDAMNTGNALPPTNNRDFASLVLPMLAANFTKVLNCQGALQNLQVVTAAASMWNAGASGPPISVYVPALAISTSQVFVVDRPGYSQLPYAFQRASSVYDIPNGDATDNGYGGLQAGISNTPASPPFILQLSGSTYSPPAQPQAAKTVIDMRHTSYQGPLVTAAVTPSTQLTTGKKIAAGVAIATGATLVGSAAYAAYTHQSLGGLWAGVWRKVKSLGRK